MLRSEECSSAFKIWGSTMPTAAFIQPTLPSLHRPQRRHPLICNANRSSPPPPKRTLLSRNLSFLPLLVRTARFSWDLFWRLMMSELAPSDAEGKYIRPTSPLSALPPPLRPEGEYAVYVGVACQWCHRVMLARALLGVPNVDVRDLDPGEDGLWRLRGDDTLLRDVYLEREPGYVGRFTAPLLVAEGGGVVSNESADILRLLGDVGGRVWLDDDTCVWLRPGEGNEAGIDLTEVDAFCKKLYAGVNDGVYRCGFATSQKAYEEAQKTLFECLDEVEGRLQKSRFLFSSNVVTEADIRLFPTVFRFDAVYAVLFKACRKSIRADYPGILEWIRDIYNMRGVRDTCDLSATRDNYYSSLFPLNPGGIVPVTPQQDLSPVPHRRNLGMSSQATLARS